MNSTAEEASCTSCGNIYIIRVQNNSRSMAGQNDRQLKTIFERTFLIFEGRLMGQVLNLAGHCPLTGCYFEACIIDAKKILKLA